MASPKTVAGVAAIAAVAAVGFVLLGGMTSNEPPAGDTVEDNGTTTGTTPSLDDLEMTLTAANGTAAILVDDAAVKVAVPPEGATIEATGADDTPIRLAFEAGSFAAATNVTLTPLADVEGLPEGFTFLTGADFAPNGLRFASPATLTFAAPPDVRPELLRVHAYTGDGVLGPPLPARIEDGEVTVQIHHFSGFAALEAEAMGNCLFVPFDSYYYHSEYVAQTQLATAACYHAVAELLGTEVPEGITDATEHVLTVWYAEGPKNHTGSEEIVDIEHGILAGSEFANWSAAVDLWGLGDAFHNDQAEALDQLLSSIRGIFDAEMEGCARASTLLELNEFFHKFTFLYEELHRWYDDLPDPVTLLLDCVDIEMQGGDLPLVLDRGAEGTNLTVAFRVVSNVSRVEVDPRSLHFSIDVETGDIRAVASAIAFPLPIPAGENRTYEIVVNETYGVMDVTITATSRIFAEWTETHDVPIITRTWTQRVYAAPTIEFAWGPIVTTGITTKTFNVADGRTDYNLTYLINWGGADSDFEVGFTIPDISVVAEDQECFNNTWAQVLDIYIRDSGGAHRRTYQGCFNPPGAFYGLDTRAGLYKRDLFAQVKILSAGGTMLPTPVYAHAVVEARFTSPWHEAPQSYAAVSQSGTVHDLEVCFGHDVQESTIRLDTFVNRSGDEDHVPYFVLRMEDAEGGSHAHSFRFNDIVGPDLRVTARYVGPGSGAVGDGDETQNLALIRTDGGWSLGIGCLEGGSVFVDVA